MDKEIIRQELAKMRKHLEEKGIIRPIRKEPQTEKEEVVDKEIVDELGF